MGGVIDHYMESGIDAERMAVICGAYHGEGLETPSASGQDVYKRQSGVRPRKHRHAQGDPARSSGPLRAAADGCRRPQPEREQLRRDLRLGSAAPARLSGLKQNGAHQGRVLAVGMITLINRLLQTEKRRICILFCTGCFCAAVFAFANARMGYLLVQLRSIEDVLALTHHPWVCLLYTSLYERLADDFEQAAYYPSFKLIVHHGVLLETGKTLRLQTLAPILRLRCRRRFESFQMPMMLLQAQRSDEPDRSRSER